MVVRSRERLTRNEQTCLIRQTLRCRADYFLAPGTGCDRIPSIAALVGWIYFFPGAGSISRALWGCQVLSVTLVTEFT